MINTIYYCLLMANISSLTSSQYDVAWEEELSKRDPNKMNQILQCGIEGSNKDRKKKAANARIINGEQTTNRRYPWVAYIYLSYKKKDGNFIRTYTCTSGGTIISNRVIISCRHCVCTSIV